jgi:hypothetical protein
MSFTRYRLLVEATSPGTYTSEELDRWASAFDFLAHWLQRKDCELSLGTIPNWTTPGIVITATSRPVFDAVQERMRLDFVNMLPPAMTDIPVYSRLVEA